MCFAAIMPALAAVGTAISAAPLAALGTAVSAAGAVVSGMQAQQAGNYNAEVARNNALAAEQKAGFEAGLIRERGAETLSAGTAAFGKAGVDLSGSTSVGATLGQTARNTEMDALAALYSGRIDANAYRAQAELERSRGRQAMVAGVINAGSTLLTGLSRRGGGSSYGAGATSVAYGT